MNEYGYVVGPQVGAEQFGFGPFGFGFSPFFNPFFNPFFFLFPFLLGALLF